MGHAIGGTPVLDRAGGERLDDWKVATALSGLVDAAGMWSRDGVLAELERTGRFLAGTWDPPEGEDGLGTAGEGSWTRFLGRIGALALRAAVEPTRDEHRQRLLAWLEIWAESPFADPSARWRTGVVRTDRKGVRDEHGAAVCIGWMRGGARKFLELRTGQGEPPSLGETVEVADLVPGGGWGSPEQIRTLVALVRERGPVPWDPSAVALLREATGLGRATASFVLAGVISRNYLPFLDADERRIHGVKVAQAEDGGTELVTLSPLERLELLADVLPADPAALWEPEGMREVAERIGAGWRAGFGRRTVVPEPTLAAVIEREPFRMTAGRLCWAFTDPSDIPTLRTGIDSRLANSDFGPYVTDGLTLTWRFDHVLVAVVGQLPWIYAELPGGDVVRDGTPGLVRVLRERLAHPGLLLDAGSSDMRGSDLTAEVPDGFGSRPYAGPEPLDDPSVDDGLTVVVRRRGSRPDDGSHMSLSFRPAFYGDDERSRRLSAWVTDRRDREQLDAVAWLRGPVCSRIVDRIGSAALPPGRYESDPAVSAPEVVALAAGKLGLDTDQARLYLQLLALPAPTDRKVKVWNGWTTARHRAARDGLLARGVVVADKRPRAGRQIFLPGDWGHAVEPYQPMELWKAALLGVERSYNGRYDNHPPLPTHALPELFAHAWTRVEQGEGPA
ncbi:hypothetical protein [Streptomyces sp. NPDC048636]|uniref:hypothetical protein n=1 Tax=Streptomyces sp. NPDC048636 TaxID=3155762 RepID=UPI003417706F